MRTYILFLLLAAAALLQQCKKPEGNDLAGEGEISGKLVISDTLKGIREEIVLKDHYVMVKNDPADAAYLFRVKTDTNGQFSITNLSAQTYYLYAEKKEGSILYTDTVKVDPAVDKKANLVLLPTAPDYNILSIITRDSSAVPVNLLNNVAICLFKTRQQAEEGNCTSAVWTATTDKNGRAQTTGLAAGWYYISATFTTENSQLIKKDSVNISATNITQKTVFLNKPVSTLTFTGEVVMVDTLWGLAEEQPLTGQPVYLKKEAERNSQAFLQQTTSNDRAVFSFAAVPPGVYSLQASKTSAGVLFTDTVTVQANAYSKLVLYPSAANYNILQVIVRDSATNGLLNNATVCLFNSRQLAASGECEGAMVSQPSNTYGKWVTTRLTPSMHYINAQLTIGTITLSIKDSVEITSSTGIYQKTIYLK